MFNSSSDLRDIYDANIVQQGEQYQIDRYYEPVFTNLKRRIKIILDKLKPRRGESILDIGCGVGTFAFHASKSGAKAYGIDYSFESLKMAAKLVDKYNTRSKAKFIAANSANIPFCDESFDKVVSVDFIEHVIEDEKNKLLDEIYRVLKPGGICIIFSPNRIREDIGSLYWGIRNKVFKDSIPKDELHIGLTNRRDFERLLTKHGFSYRTIYEDTTRPYLAKLPFLKNALALYILWIVKKNNRLLQN